MSAPQTNIETQEARHRPALRGMAVAVGFAVVLLIGLITYVVQQGGTPTGAETQVDGRTGAVTEES